MYYLAIRQFARSLRNLDAILEKAIAHAKARGFDVNNFIPQRLSPDMLPFVSQVRIACDVAKATAGNLSGKEPPKHEDNETTFDELRARIAKCLVYLDGFTAQDFAAPRKVIQLPRTVGKGLPVDEYVMSRQLPNFCFHVTTAYALLRQGGVELGKGDYLGKFDLIDL
jgi:hypothetical protein